MPEGSYFESHLAVVSKASTIEELRSGIFQTSVSLPLHLSRNIFKKTTNEDVIIMATLRDYASDRTSFVANVTKAKKRIEELGFYLAKPAIVEFAVFDTNTHHDDQWLKRIA